MRAGVLNTAIATAVPATVSAISVAQIHTGMRLLAADLEIGPYSGKETGETAPCDPIPAIHFSSRFRSPASCQRSSGSFAKQVLVNRSNASGVSGCRVESGGGSICRIAAIRLA